MSQPTRYDAADLRCKKCQKNVEVLGVLRSHDEGRFVMWDDYAALQAENDRMHGQVEHYIDALGKQEVLNLRLVKAGNDMDAYLKRLDGTTNGVLDCRRDWNAAKESQP